MSASFDADGRAVLIGSLPIEDHRQAADWVAEATPEIPGWAQLPARPAEDMVTQFLPGMPGWRPQAPSAPLATDAGDFEAELVAFYEEYLAVQAGELALDASRFVLGEDAAPGFHELLRRLGEASEPPAAVKGQVTGPFTFATAVRDARRRPVFYDAQLREAAVKLLAMKAAWQVERLRAFGRPVLVFADEPGLAGFGSSEFISVAAEEVRDCLAEVIGAVRGAGGLAGVHVCANTEWSLLLDAAPDILSFDAYGYFERLALYAGALKRFVDGGGILCWGIVPTTRAEDIAAESAGSLLDRLRRQVAELERLGVDGGRLRRQMLVSPSCGAGALGAEAAARVLATTRELGERLRTGGIP